MPLLILCFAKRDDLEAGGKRPVIMPMPQADFVLVDSFQLLGYGSSITKCFQRSCKLQCGTAAASCCSDLNLETLFVDVVLVCLFGCGQFCSS